MPKVSVIIPTYPTYNRARYVAEAMACGCAVVATAVGGVTNMIIDGYNGMLCMPEVTELEQCIEELIIDEAKRRWIASNGYETVKTAFSKERWERSWSKVIETIAR